MNIKINIWTLTHDDGDGLGCKLFKSEDELLACLGAIMLGSIQEVKDEQAELIRSQIEIGDFDSAYPAWSELYRNELDYYSWGCCEYECEV